MIRKSLLARGAMAAAAAVTVYACDNAAKAVYPLTVDLIFANYVALGNSLTAGFQSGGINDSTQRQSYAFLLAGQMGTRFAYPSLVKPGCPAPIATFATGALVSGVAAN